MNDVNWQYKLMRHLTRFIINIFMRIQVTGSNQDLSKTNYVIVSNHKSWLDPLLILAFLPPMQIGFMAEGTSALQSGLIQNILKHIHLQMVMVNRGCKKSRIKSFLKARKILRSGTSFLIFPEGRLNQSDNLMYPFFMGAFQLATKNEVPILPIVIRGNEKLYFRRKIHIHIGSPIQVTNKDHVETITRQTYHLMNGLLKPKKPLNSTKKKHFFDITMLFLGEMAEAYETKDIVITAEEAMKVFDKVNKQNHDKYIHS